LNQLRSIAAAITTVLGLCAWDSGALFAASSLSINPTVEAGYETGWHKASRSQRISRPFLLAGVKPEWGPMVFDLGLRVRKDYKPAPCGKSLSRCDDRTTLDIRSANATFNSDLMKITAGYFIESWGETFGVYPLDVVNPRDHGEVAFTEFEETKLAVLGLNSTVYAGPVKVQAIVVPKPARADLPETVFDLTMRDEVSFEAGADMEYGGRASTLLSGIDVSLFFYDHWNRMPVFANIRENFKNVLVHRAYTVKTYGASYSYATQAMVFRGDFALHQGQPVTTTTLESLVAGKLNTPVLTDQFQSILGVDYTTEGGLTTGVQYHLEVWKDQVSEVMKNNNRHWVSTQVVKAILDGAVEFKLFIFRGLDNNDILARPLVTWHPTEATSLSLEADMVEGKGDGYLEPLREEDRLWLRGSYKL